MTVLIKLTTAGADTGPFNLYSDASVPPYSVAFNPTLVSKLALLAGYPSDLVPNGTTIIRVQSVNSLCNNYIPLTVTGSTTTTTSSSSTSTTSSTSSTSTSTSSTSTTSSSSTTTTTTTAALAVGQNYQGGIIAYLDGEGGGLIISPNDLGPAIWGCDNDYVLNLAGDEIGAGRTAIYEGNLNTEEIVGPYGCPTPGIAARLCDSYSNGGYSDWYLADENEWFAIATSYVNILDGIQNKDNPIFNFTNPGGYWSSNQGQFGPAASNLMALYPSPDDVVWASSNKLTSHLVRPIRKLTTGTTSTTSSSSTTTTTTTTPEVFTHLLQQSSSYCVGGVCNLNGTINNITVYSLDETLVAGSYIYIYPALTIPYTTELVSDGQYIFNVSSFGQLSITCTIDLEC